MATDVVVGTIRRRAIRGRFETPVVAGADQHNELPTGLEFREGRDVTAAATSFAQKMALPVVFPSA